jgi:hypothetical protein
LYGKLHGERALEGLVTEAVIFTMLSESQRGPRLLGVFPGGRLEEYIPVSQQQIINSSFYFMESESIMFVFKSIPLPVADTFTITACSIMLPLTLLTPNNNPHFL